MASEWTPTDADDDLWIFARMASERHPVRATAIGAALSLSLQLGVGAIVWALWGIGAAMVAEAVLCVALVVGGLLMIRRVDREIAEIRAEREALAAPEPVWLGPGVDSLQADPPERP